MTEVFERAIDDRKLAQHKEELENKLFLTTKELVITKKELGEAESRIHDLESDLKLNASMLAKQTDLAREAETEREYLSHRLIDARMSIVGLLKGHEELSKLKNNYRHALRQAEARIKELESNWNFFLKNRDELLFKLNELQEALKNTFVIDRK